jgi:hypothetical protein
VIATTYQFPFPLDVPVDNPWDGRRAVEISIQANRPLDDAGAERVRAELAPFWHLAAAGGLGGATMAPWQCICPEPTLLVQQGIARLRFAPCALDEKATSCLVCLLLALHEDIPLSRASLSVAGSQHHILPFDPKLDDPYPPIWPRLPFVHEVEDSESETRTLRALFNGTLADEQVEAVHRELKYWGAAAEAGAFGVAPVPPRQSGCLAANPVEHYEGELLWAIEKCRFDPRGGFDSLVCVGAAIHYRIAAVQEMAVE